jgi:hypothetical protein
LQLLEIGERLMAESKPQPGTAISRQQAVDYRNGLLFAFVAFVPIRPRNLVALEFDRQLIRNGDDWFVVVPGDETKTETPLNFKIPGLLASYLIFYIDVVRPKLLRGATCRAVWVSRDGAAALSYVGVVKAFQSVSKHFNLPVAPHDVRDAAATTWAIAAPESIGVAVDLLGHRGPRMMRHYNRAKGIEASRAYRNMLAELRKQSAKTNRGKRKRWLGPRWRPPDLPESAHMPEHTGETRCLVQGEFHVNRTGCRPALDSGARLVSRKSRQAWDWFTASALADSVTEAYSRFSMSAGGHRMKLLAHRTEFLDIYRSIAHGHT